MEDQRKLKKLVVEAILFSSSEFVPIEEIKKVVGLTDEDLNEIISELQEEYENHAFEIVRLKDKLKIQLKKEFYDIAQEFMEKPLSDDELKLASAVLITGKLEAIKALRLLGKSYTEVVEALLKKGVIKVVNEKGRKFFIPGDRVEEYIELSPDLKRALESFK